jgi:hypothetical protein
VAIAVPFHSTTDPVTKPEPATVSWKADPPAIAELGDKPLITAAAGAFTVKNCPPVVVPPGFVTVTIKVPAAANWDAEIVALACVAPDITVGRVAPFQVATEFETKLVPVKVIVRPDEPAVAEVGEMLVRVGPATLKTTPLVELPPGLVTVMNELPTDCMRLLLTDALNWVALTNVVGNAVPFHCTVDPFTNAVPLTVNCRVAEPAGVEVGEMLVNVADVIAN